MGMLCSVLAGSFVLFLMLFARRKKYDVPMKKMIVLHVVVTILTTLGANLGSFLGGMSFLGLRLYGFILLDTVAMFALARVFRIEIGSLGDYLAASIIAVCCIVKVPCILDGCCYGKEIFVDAMGNVVRFPSQIVEFSIWGVLTAWLLWIERKGNHKNLLWAISAIWFGVFRFLVDIMRGNPNELKLVILGLPGGRFWSLIITIIGVAYLIYSFRKYKERYPSMKEVLRVVVGLKA